MADDSNRVVFLRLSDDQERDILEREFVSELRMTLDGTVVIERRIREPSFAHLPMNEQASLVRPLLEKDKAVAAIWLTKAKSGVIVLHVVVVSQGRALARLVEAPADGAFNTGLAAAARELLKASYLFKEPEPKWSFLADARSLGGLVGDKGPGLWLGGAVGLERWLVAGLSVRLWAGAFGGPIGSAKDLDAAGWSLAPGLGALYLWDLGHISLGPVVGFRSWWSNVSLRAGDGPKERSIEWQFQTFVDLELRIHATKKLDIALGGGACVTPLRDTYHRTSDDVLVYATPFLSWEAFVGVVLPIY
ncbi:MAG: hypothetical protein GY854_14195 [Deltaproteobacteria bacterium]|nr:hypothetical protein [Deltaproteobacteria bacterium]